MKTLWELFLTGLLLLAIGITGQSCVQKVRQDQFRPVYPSKALHQLSERQP